MAIEINQLKKEDIGKWVEYIPVFEGASGEKGRIKRWNEEWIFVVYKCDEKWVDYQNYTAAATTIQPLSP